MKRVDLERQKPFHTRGFVSGHLPLSLRLNCGLSSYKPERSEGDTFTNFIRYLITALDSHR